MSDQIRISETGEQCVLCGQPLEEHWVGSCPDPIQPRTWDGEPLYSPETVQEGLFPREAFDQMRGQMAMEEEAKERSTCSECLARTYRGEECVCDDGGDAEDYDEIMGGVR